MPRAARIVIPDFPHHITHRGNNKQPVFFSRDNYYEYLNFLRRQCELSDVQIIGYCLMTNHIHLILIPSRVDSLSSAVGKAHANYTQFINRTQDSSGHLWAGRFHSCPLADDHLLTAMRYIERNPVRAGIVDYPWSYVYSSANAHIGEKDTLGILSFEYFNTVLGRTDLTWIEYLGETDREEDIVAIRKCTIKGKPFGKIKG